LVAATVGALIGIATGYGTQQTVIEKFFPNRSVLTKPVDIQEVLAEVEPATVSIDTTQFSGSSNSGSGVLEGAGTGMILTPTGEVLTNNHVVAGANAVTVTLFGQTQALAAHVIGTDPAQDVALVQIDDAHDLPTVKLGDSSNVLVGDDVLAIGNALALAGGPSVTEGIVSAEGRSLSAQSDFSNTSEQLSGLLQTDAPINPGNSGGPLVNSSAEVIGMNTAVAESGQGNAPAQNIGFAIAINTIKPLLPGLLRGGTGGVNGGRTPTAPKSKTAYLGVVIQSVTPSVAQQQHLTPKSGALVEGLDPTGPSIHAGMKVGDVIVSIDGQAVTSVASLVTVLHRHQPGQVVTVGIYRGTQMLTLHVTLGTEP
jgi:serine protease Do